MSSSPTTAERSGTLLAAPRAGRDWCLFVDRDGVINRRIPDDYVRTRDQWEFLPGALEALRILAEWAPHLVIVTNQRGVGRGLIDPVELERIHADLRAAVAAVGGRIDDILVCPHLQSDDCPCRKPRAGLALDWLAAHPAVDGAFSAMVGDSPSDMGMATSLAAVTGGCAAVLIGDAEAETRFRHTSLLEFALEVNPI
jgi:D-glycero-D-manno-heptose 1,7-bisphosphate phosphatase